MLFHVLVATPSCSRGGGPRWTSGDARRRRVRAGGGRDRPQVAGAADVGCDKGDCRTVHWMTAELTKLLPERSPSTMDRPITQPSGTYRCFFLLHFLCVCVCVLAWLRAFLLGSWALLGKCGYFEGLSYYDKFGWVECDVNPLHSNISRQIVIAPPVLSLTQKWFVVPLWWIGVHITVGHGHSWLQTVSVSMCMCMPIEAENRFVPRRLLVHCSSQAVFLSPCRFALPHSLQSDTGEEQVCIVSFVVISWFTCFLVCFPDLLSFHLDAACMLRHGSFHLSFMSLHSCSVPLNHISAFPIEYHSLWPVCNFCGLLRLLSAL